MWFAEDGDRVGRITPSGKVTEFGAAVTDTCVAKKSGARTRITCTIRPAPGKTAHARLSRAGKTVARGQLTARGQVVFITGHRPSPGTYRLTFGKTTITVHLH